MAEVPRTRWRMGAKPFAAVRRPSEARLWVKLAARRLFNLYYQTLPPRGLYVLVDNY